MELPEGPARITLDHDGFEVRPPGREYLVRDVLQVSIGVLFLVATVASIVALLGGNLRGFGCFVLIAPGFALAMAHAAGQRLLLRLRGVRSLRCTPSEVVITRPGLIERHPLAEVKRVWTATDGVGIAVGSELEHVAIAASEEQIRWIAASLRDAAARARRIPEPEPPPEALRRARERGREREQG